VIGPPPPIDSSFILTPLTRYAIFLHSIERLLVAAPDLRHLRRDISVMTNNVTAHLLLPPITNPLTCDGPNLMQGNTPLVTLLTMSDVLGKAAMVINNDADLHRIVGPAVIGTLHVCFSLGEMGR
jgi:hypothetical protein